MCVTLLVAAVEVQEATTTLLFRGNLVARAAVRLGLRLSFSRATEQIQLLRATVEAQTLPGRLTRRAVAVGLAQLGPMVAVAHPVPVELAWPAQSLEVLSREAVAVVVGLTLRERHADWAGLAVAATVRQAMLLGITERLTLVGAAAEGGNLQEMAATAARAL
jgi:hypothetical protein